MPDYEKTRMISTRRWKRGAILAAMGIAVIALASVGVWMSPGGGKGQELGTGQRRFERGSLNETGTTGRADAAENSGPAATPITDPVDAITGPAKVRDLVGRRVQMQVPIGPHVNDVAFWVRHEEQPLLAVLSRDSRNGAERQRGDATSATIGDGDTAGTAIITGRIEQIPNAEAMHSWGLTNPDREQLLDRPVYLRVTRIDPVSGR